MIDTASRTHLFLTTSLALLSFLFLSLLISCTGSVSSDPSSPTNSEPTAITGTLTYSALDIIAGTASTANPTWSGALTNQTVTYTLVRQSGTRPASITIDSSTGTISLATNALIPDSGTYTITATGTGNYQGNTTADIVITVTENIQGTFTYSALDIEEGSTTNTTPIWTGALADQTVTYGIVRQGPGNIPASITIDSSTGIISIAANAVIADSGTYTITASGSGQYSKIKQTTLTITLRTPGVPLTAIEGTLSYSSVNIEEGTVTNANPTWTGALTGQTVTYGIVRKNGASLPANITIDSSTGTISVATSVLAADSGTYTITASGSGQYNGNTSADIMINITGDIQGTLTYSPLDALVGGTSPSTANPTWTGALASQTVTYNIVRQDGASLPASITIDNSTGTINVGTSAQFEDHGTYTITATGTGNYRGNTTADVVVTITMIINTAAELQAITNNIITLDSITYNDTGTNDTGAGATGKYIGGNYQLGGDIDLSRMTDFTPIGNIRAPFIGIFDGKGYTVTLVIDTTEDQERIGLFGYVGINETYTDDTTAVNNRNNAIEIKNIGVNSTITGGNRVGGLVGILNGGSLIGYSEVVINAGAIIGGLVGELNGGSVIGYATGNISGTIRIGGLVGNLNRGSVIGYATGKIMISHTTPFGNYHIGGLVGAQSGGTSTGYAAVNIPATTGNSPIKGFTGYKTGGTIQGGYFDATTAGKGDTEATSISAVANIYKFVGSAETSGRTIGKFYDKATGTSATAKDSGDTEIFAVQEFIDAFNLANTANGRFPKLKTSLFGSLTQP